MTVSKAKKDEILATLESTLKDSTSVAFTTNNKLTVLEISNIRKDLRSVGGTFMLAKKTLIRLAFKNVFGVEFDADFLPGQVAVLISKQDKIAAIAVVNKHAQELKKEEKIKFVGAYFDGKVLNAVEAAKIANLPSKEVLLAKLLGSMKAPISALARFFDAAKTDLENRNLKTVQDLTLPVVAKTETPKEEVKAVEEVTAAVETPVVTEAVAEEVSAEVAPAVETPAETPVEETVAE